MVERLEEAVRTELTTLEEVLTQRTELVAATRGARRQAEAVAQQLQGLAFWQGVPLSPLQVAEDVSFVEEYRWATNLLALWRGSSAWGVVPHGHRALSELRHDQSSHLGTWRVEARDAASHPAAPRTVLPARRLCSLSAVPRLRDPAVQSWAKWGPPSPQLLIHYAIPPVIRSFIPSFLDSHIH